jgi:hypothetical protein
MNKLFALTLLLATLPNFAFAGGDKTPMEKDAQIQGILANMSVPTYISIKSMATPTLTASTGNPSLSFTVSGAAQTKNEQNLDKLINDSSVKQIRDGGLEIQVKASGLYDCRISTENGSVTEVSGACLTNIQINFAGTNSVPVYLNGTLMNFN